MGLVGCGSLPVEVYVGPCFSAKSAFKEGDVLFFQVNPRGFCEHALSEMEEWEASLFCFENCSPDQGVIEGFIEKASVGSGAGIEGGLLFVGNEDKGDRLFIEEGDEVKGFVLF